MLRIQDELRSATEYFRRQAEERGVAPTSHLYVILDFGGGWRFVVTPPYDIKNHPIKGERAIEVPGIRIAEPVPEGDTFRMLRLASRYVTLELAPKNPCDSCTVCCTNLAIGVGENVNNSCENIDKDCVGGCVAHVVRPKSCRDFECEWLKSQRVNDRMSPKLRPDRCGTMFVQNKFDPDLIEVHHDCTKVRKEGRRVREHIQSLEKYGKRIVRV